MRSSLILLFASMLMSVSAQSFETTKALKKDFQQLKTKTFPEKKAKAKKKLSETTDNINSKIQKKLKN